MAETIELNISANVNEAMKEVAGFRREYTELVRQVEKPLRQVNSFRELESSLEQTGRKMREARDRVRELGNSLAPIDRPTKEMAASYKLAVSELRALERQELTQIGQLSKMRAALQGTGVDMRNLGAEQRRLATEFSTRLDAGRADAALNSARSSLGVGAIEQTQRQLVDLRQQYRLVTSDSALSAKQRAEAEANYRHSVEQTLARLRELRQASAAPAGRAQSQASDAASRQAALSALGVGTIEQTQRQLVELRQQYRLLANDGTLSAKQRAEAEANYRSSVASTLAQLRALRGGLSENGQVMQRAGMSVGQYSQAMRLLPMQLTDVATSLASGMPLWMVAIQQGGQISDSFGGIGNALDLLGNKIGGLVGGAADRSLNFIGALTGGAEAAAVAQTALADGARDAAVAVEDAGGGLADAASSANDLAEAGERANAALSAAPPATISGLAIAVSIAATAAAVAALVVAYRQGAAEGQAYNQALIMTGNAAGTSSDALAGMAQRIADTNGTVGNAAAVLAEVAGTGKFAATQIEAVGAAAVAMEDAIGRAASDTAAEFVKLAEAPVAASVKLDKQYNYLTASVYQQIRALEEQGDTQGAAQLATDAYAEAMQERAGQIVDSLGTLDSAWRAVGDGAAWAWDRMRDIGRPDTLEDQLARATQELERLQKLRGQAAGGYDRKGAAAAEVARLQADIQARDAAVLEKTERDKVKNDGIAAEQKLAQALTATASAAEKRAKALADIDKWAADAAAAGMPYSEEKLQQLRDAAQKQYASEADRYADNLRRQVDLHGEVSEAARLRYAIERGELGKLTDEQQKSLIADAEALDAKKAAADAARDAATAAEQQARQTEQLAREQLAYVAGLERQATVVGMTSDGVRRYELQEKKLAGALRERADAALDAIEAGEQQKKLAEDLARLQERGAQLEQSIAQNLRGQRDQNDAEIGGYGLGARERERIAAERAIRAEYQRYQDELNESTPASMIGGAEYLEQVTTIQNGLNAALDENADAWARSEAAMGDWSRGASEAFANYMAEAQDIAGQTEQMIGSALESLAQGIGDSFAQAIVYGDDLRETMSGLAQTILSEVISSLIQMGVRYGINAALQSSAIQTVTATKTAADATMAASAVAATATVTTALTAAAATATTAWTPAAVAASIGSFGTAAAIGIAAVLAAMAIAKGFSTGGHVTGPGSGTSDDIPAWLSNGEFVTREAVVSQPGAKAFLESFNARGMAAVDDYAKRVRHATGGLAGVPAPALPSPSVGSSQLADPGKALSATVNNRQTFNLIDSPERIASALNTPAGQEAFTVMLSNDPAKFRSILGV